MPKSATDRRHFIIVGVLIAITTVFLEWLLATVLPLPVQASIEAVIIDELIGWHLWVIAFLFALVVVFMLYSVVVFRRREGDETEGAHFEGHTVLEIVWTAVPLVIVVIFSFYGLSSLDAVLASDPDEVTIQAEGFQWGWVFTYENGVQSQELILPHERRVHMELVTRDVNHSFWIPEFRVKSDLLGGQVNNLRFTPTILSADYEVEHGRKILLVCAEMCGLSHWRMTAPVTIVPRDEFIAWLDQQLVEQTPAVAQK